ncbi:hypothetical protein PYCCODRAFT_11109 [Trametes coccinea BRFM310]|uniref:Uncharacterized protein n=1 Tax=Trametes coccinea (strain BRFM310) TaxID=1353009 RepID=A0A1Y2J4I4_TRAC3|nr:hypothetical protein PYCCODRAFT_11109 [Trametes coccinea BRFM310]
MKTVRRRTRMRRGKEKTHGPVEDQRRDGEESTGSALDSTAGVLSRASLVDGRLLPRISSDLALAGLSLLSFSSPHTPCRSSSFMTVLIHSFQRTPTPTRLFSRFATRAFQQRVRVDQPILTIPAHATCYHFAHACLAAWPKAAARTRPRLARPRRPQPSRLDLKRPNNCGVPWTTYTTPWGRRDLAISTMLVAPVHALADMSTIGMKVTEWWMLMQTIGAFFDA